MDHSEEQIQQIIHEQKNSWARLEEVVKINNIPYMLKLRFQDISNGQQSY